MLAAVILFMTPLPLGAEDGTGEDLRKALEEKDRQIKELLERVERLERLNGLRPEPPPASPDRESLTVQGSAPPRVPSSPSGESSPVVWRGLRPSQEGGVNGQGVKFAIPSLGGDVKISGDYWLMGFHWNTPYFGNPVFGARNFSWGEQFGRLRADFETEDKTFGLSLAANYGMTVNEDAYSGPFLAPVFGTDNFRERFALDVASISFRRPFGLPAEFTLGRQLIRVADQFVVGIGELSDAAIWLIPIQSFPVAFRSLWDLPKVGPIGDLKLDAFVARTDPKSGARDVIVAPDAPLGLGTSLRNAGRDGTFFGTSLHWAFRDLVNGDVAFFNFEDDKGFNTRAWDVRIGIPKLLVPWLSFTAEVVGEFGDLGPREREDVLGFHGDLKAAFPDLPLKPTLLLRYTDYSGDDPTTPEFEGFDPLFFGFPDFGEWVQGEITGEYLLFNTNERIIQVRLELSPLDKLLLRFWYYKFWLDEPGAFVGSAPANNPNFADELNAAIQYSFTDRIIGMLIGAVNFPGRGAIQAFGSGNVSGLVETLWIVAF